MGKYKKQENSKVIAFVKQHDVQKMNATFNGWNSHITMDGNEFHGEYVNGLPNDKSGIFMEDHLCYLGISKTECYQGQESFGFYREIYEQFQGKQSAGMDLCYFADGDKYSGQFKNGYPWKGCWIEENGDKYVGSSKTESITGEGIRFQAQLLQLGFGKGRDTKGRYMGPMEQ